MKTGVIGLGAMGRPIAHNLYKAGYLSTFWNRTGSVSVQFSEEIGIPASPDLKHVAENSELIITCLSRDLDVIEIVEQLLPLVNPATILLDISTTHPKTAIDLQRQAEKYQCQFIDAPVSGGVEGAGKGTLSMMPGCDEQQLLPLLEPLSCITSSVKAMGKTGAGQMTKAVNQIMAAGINQSVTTALAFARASGLPAQDVVDVISKGAAGNWFLQHRGKSMLKGEFKNGFKVELHHKDLEICQNLLETFHINDVGIIENTLNDYKTLMQQGFGDEDISALFRLKEK